MKEADGTTRIVEYTADDHNGFNAVVKKIGHAEHPAVEHKSHHSHDFSHDHGHGHSYEHGHEHGFGHDYGHASSYIKVEQH